MRQRTLLALGLTDDLYLTIPRGSYDSLSTTLDLDIELIAPLEASASVGSVRVLLDDESVSEVPLVVLHDVSEANLWTQLKDEIMLWLQ